MKSYVLNIVYTGAISEIFAEFDREAIDQAVDILGKDDVLVGKNWIDDGVNCHNEPCKKIWFWPVIPHLPLGEISHAVATLSTIK